MHTVQADPAAAATTTAAMPRTSQRRRATIWLPVCLAPSLITLLALDYRPVVATLAAAIVWAVAASAGWLAVAAGLAFASMIAFGLLRRSTVAAAGGTLSIREAVAVSYAAGAIHMSAPGGVVLSAAYVFRRLQHRDVPPAAITWSVAISGVVSSITLVALGVAGIAASRTSGSLAALLPAAVLAMLIAVLVIALVRRADQVTRLAVCGLRAINRLLRRPTDAGVRSLRATAADLRAIRPAPVDWLAAGGAATAKLAAGPAEPVGLRSGAGSARRAVDAAGQLRARHGQCGDLPAPRRSRRRRWHPGRRPCRRRPRADRRRRGRSAAVPRDLPRQQARRRVEFHRHPIAAPARPRGDARTASLDTLLACAVE